MSKKIIYVKEAPGSVVSFYAPVSPDYYAGRELVLQALTGWYCFKTVDRVYDQGNGWCRVFLE
ncbi:hypothetical protein IDJ77_16335 [Mucilaginibacter sp. ZT4R22]|uniref:Uncharacterized protein n=1 Tax=Mucilaginibacter pankratovii TaxID=2772110 RepID=A0ABR7WSV0_9SPHI|nr:hypothetical protein [Mucilaginibacter pankratovii]MBD1365383.1 hypothetical protein [Mucilaginibacter pankratovii]